MGFDFSAKRKEVEHPGSRGGHGYFDEHGRWQYGDRPTGPAPPPLTLTPTAPTPRPALYGETLPEHAKQYVAPGHPDAGKGDVSDQPWEVLEGPFITVQTACNIKRVERQGKHTLAREWGDPNSPKGRELRVQLRALYGKAVRLAISKGKPVPREVIRQGGWPEFRKAVHARQRYEKGYHTSFANRSIAVTEQLVVSHGVKVKRQDGKPMTMEQRQHLANGVRELADAVGMGDLSDVWRGMDVTLAHTNGRMPFLRKAGGLWIPDERTVSVGVKGMNAIAHELLGHALDAMAGIRANYSVREEVRKGKWEHVNYISSVDKFGDTNGARLMRMATASMRDPAAVKKMMTIEGANMSPDQLENLRVLKAGLGHYWSRPFEIWARLVEQYVATVRDERRGAEEFTRPHLGLGPSHPTVVDYAIQQQKRRQDSSNDHRFYERANGWWPPETFAKLRPMVEQEIRRRITIMRTGEDPDREAADKIDRDRLAFARVKRRGPQVDMTERQQSLVPPPAGFSDRMRRLSVGEQVYIHVHGMMDQRGRPAPESYREATITKITLGPRGDEIHYQDTQGGGGFMPRHDILARPRV